MPLTDADPITPRVLAMVADLLRNAAPGNATILVDPVGRTVRLTLKNVGRDALKDLAAAAATKPAPAS